MKCNHCTNEATHFIRAYANNSSGDFQDFDNTGCCSEDQCMKEEAKRGRNVFAISRLIKFTDQAGATK